MTHRLFPPIEPHATGRLAVDPPHSLYWEESGNPRGIPVVFLHGGPGAGTSPMHRRFFDPAAYRIVLFDQRGCGRSTPTAEIAGNTTQALVGDMEALRESLGIGRWLVFGGSWGSSLGLAYAQTHRERCLGLILRGVFLCTSAEIDWFMTGMGRFFPEAAARFLDHLPSAERADPLGAYLARLNHPDPAVHGPAAEAWCRYEAECSTLKPDPALVDAFVGGGAALSLARLEAHYFANALFLEEGALLRGAGRLAGLTGHIVQGRYDVVCPPSAALALARAWPGATLEMIADAGHSATEPGIAAALVAATEAFRRDLAALAT